MHIGFGEIRGRVGILEGRTQGNNGEQEGAVYRQPGTEVDDSCHIWRKPSKWKGTQRGASKGSKGSKGKCAMYIRKRNVSARVIEPLE
jgi:hypothetical protein